MYMASNTIYCFAFIADVPFVKKKTFVISPPEPHDRFQELCKWIYVSKKEMKEHTSLDTKRTSLSVFELKC